MADVEYKATLDDREVLASLKNIDRNMDKLAGQGNQSFTRVGKSAAASGLQIGLVSGVVQELTRRFIDMAAQAARAFVEVAAGGVQLNRELETTRIALTNIFEGNERAADAFIGQVDTLAARLRVDFQELRTLGKGILPDIGDAQQTLKVMEQFVVLGRDAGQNFTSIRIALEEAATGQFTSLQRRLNIPAESIRRIKALSEEIGIADALIEVLGDRIQKAGLNIEDFADTFEAQIGALKAGGRELQAALGEPIFEELKEQAGAFLDILETKGPSIEDAAVAFGDLAASVIELIGSNLQEFLESLDFEQLEQTADALNDMVAALDLLVQVLGLVPDANAGLEQTGGIFEAMIQPLVTAAQLIAIIKAGLDALPVANLEFIVTGNPAAMIRDMTEAQASGKTMQERYRESLLESAKAFDLFNQKLAENEENTRKRHEEVEETTQADIDAGDAILDHKKRLEELAKAEAGAADAREKIGAELAETIKDRERKLLEIQIDAEREALEDAIKAAQKREDLARENAQDIEDIWREHAQEIADAATDLTREEEDIYRKYSRDRQEIERDAANRRVEIETEYRRELERIRDRFNESAEEAERRNDAQAFLEAVRTRDREVEDAKRTRDEGRQDAARQAEEQRAALNEQLQFEIEDARIANARKLEDLQLRLQRELEEQAIQYQREIDEQTIQEQRQAEQRALAYQQELEDFARKEAQKLQDLQTSLTAEFETVKKYEDLKKQARVAAAEETVQRINEIYKRLNPFGGSSGGQYYYRGAAQRQHGGDVEPGRPYVVGEAGPELFIPKQAGAILPNRAMSVPASVPSISAVYNQQRQVDVGGINVAQDIFSNPTAVRKMRNIIMGVMSEVL